MKKRIFTLSVVSLLALAATGCSSDVKSNKGPNGEDVIVTIKNGDSEIKYTANELFSDYLSTTAGASAAYSAVYDVLVGAGVATTQEIANRVATEVAKLQNDAKTSASTNGTSYKEELSKALESAGAEDLDEYSKIQELTLKKSKFETEYYDSQLYDGKMTDEAPKIDDNNQFSNYYLEKEFIKNNNPYHVRHILVKTSSSGESYLPDAETLSEDEAKKLGNVIKNLANTSSTFGQVATDFSDDGSSSTFGTLNELMGRSTSYVNEFKFGVFQYDALLNPVVENGATSLGIPSTIEGISENTEDVLKESMSLIPFNAAQALIDNASITKDKNGDNYKEGSEKYFPRNYIFSHYFSNHGLNFIFRGKSGNTSTNFKSNAKVNELFADYFTANGYSGNERDILCDENGTPIIVTRAGSGSGDSGYQGIHFIVIENSPLVNENKLVNGVYPAGTSFSYDEELKYYSVNVPNKKVDSNDNDKRYVTFIDSTKKTDYNERATEIETAVKNYDSNITFRLYEKLKQELGDKLVIDDTINNIIESYITTTRNKSNRSTEESYNDSWKNYINQLLVQKEFAGYKISESTITTNFNVVGSLNIN